MSVGAIIPARMSSRRLPGKVLMDLGGHSMLYWVVNGARAAKKVERIVVLTTEDTVDAPIWDECAELCVECWRGSTDRDVLGDFRSIARTYLFDPVVRVTADCPLISPVVIDRVIDEYMKGCDYACNGVSVEQRTFPRGLDVDVVSYTVLAWMDDNLKPVETPFGRYHPDYRKHVTFYIRENPGLFTVRTVEADLDRFRLVVDTQDEYDRMRELFDRMGDNPSWLKALDVIECEPGLGTIETPDSQTKMKWRVW